MIDPSHWPEWLLAALGGAAGLKGLGWAGFVKQHGAPMVVDTLRTNTDARAVVTAIAREAIDAHDVASADRHREHARAEIDTQVNRVDGGIRQLVESAVHAATDRLGEQIAGLAASIEAREREKAAHAAETSASLTTALQRLSTEVAQLRALGRQQIDTPRELAGRGMPAEEARRGDSGRLPRPDATRRPTPALGVTPGEPTR